MGGRTFETHCIRSTRRSQPNNSSHLLYVYSLWRFLVITNVLHNAVICIRSATVKLWGYIPQGRINWGQIGPDAAVQKRAYFFLCIGVYLRMYIRYSTSTLTSHHRQKGIACDTTRFLANVNVYVTFAICHRRSVCLSSVTLVHSTQLVEIFHNFFSAYDTRVC